MINIHKKFNRPFFFAGGAWCWKTFVPKHDYIIESTGEAIKACRDNGVNDILMTVWGDDGSECSRFAVLPQLMFAAEASRGNTDIESIKEKFREIVGDIFIGKPCRSKTPNTWRINHITTET